MNPWNKLCFQICVEWFFRSLPDSGRTSYRLTQKLVFVVDMSISRGVERSITFHYGYSLICKINTPICI